MVNIIWATRGRSWDFRFLLSGDYSDPLPAYERAFIGMQGETAACQRVGGVVALRFPDPLDRRDDAGRIIPHDFVLLHPLADEVRSVLDGHEKVWPLVAEVYDQIWTSGPPSTRAVQSIIDNLPPRGLNETFNSKSSDQASS